MVRYVSLHEQPLVTSQGERKLVVESIKRTLNEGDTFYGKPLWVDLIQPTEKERQQVENLLKVELFTAQESEEIESSSKYFELDGEVGINLSFLYPEGLQYINEPVSFILRDDFLITQRQKFYPEFSEVHYRIEQLDAAIGIDVFMSILERRIDSDADLIENIIEQTSKISRKLVEENDLDRYQLLTITALQQSTIMIRENIVEKQRVLSAILKSKFFPQKNYEKLQVMIRDVGSLLDHTNFNFQRLEFSQNTLLGLINMEQNRVMKIFTLATVLLMPPTLIAGIYGMNFSYMPELNKPWGYPFALALMALTAGGVLLLFKRKKYL